MGSVTEIKVFVGSPGDVAAERARAFEVIERLNQHALLPDDSRLQGIGWDRTHHTKPMWLTPQQAIGAGLPRPSQCEIAVFVFWKRIGTVLRAGSFEPNGAGAEPTGSLWELYDALEATPRRQVLVYRCTRKPTPDDDDYTEFARQAEGVKHFFADTFRDEQQRWQASYCDYQSVDDFAQHLEQDLAKFLKALAAPGSDGAAPAAPAPPSPARVPGAYLQRLAQRLAEVELLGLDLKESISNGLPQIYVPALTRREGDPGEREMRAGREPRELLLHRLGEESLYVPGDPGSGKSTFCQWAAFVVARGSVPPHTDAQQDGEASGAADLDERLPDALAGRLPLHVRLRDFWTHLHPGPDQQQWHARQLEQAIVGWVRDTRPFDLDAHAFEDNLREGNVLLVLDGVDEVPEEDLVDGRIAWPRACLLSGLADALGRWGEAGNRVLLTSRPYGLSEAWHARLALTQAPLLALDADLQRLFIRRWYAAADPARREELASGLWAELRNRNELLELRRNPLLLTALCVKFKEGKRLPQDVYDLYDAVVNQVLFNRFRGGSSERSRVRWRLEAVALGMHHGLGETPRPAPLASVPEEELDAILAHYARANRATEGGAGKVLERREQLLNRSGLLLPRGEGRAEFYHQDFRDFLAAEGWAREQRTLDDALARFGGEPGWRRMLGFLFAKQVGARGVDPPLRALAALAAEAGSQSLLLADCLEIAAGKAEEGALAADWAVPLRVICRRALATGAPAAERNALFLALGRLGWDDRPGVGLVPRGGPTSSGCRSHAATARRPSTYRVTRSPQASFRPSWTPATVARIRAGGRAWRSAGAIPRRPPGRSPTHRAPTSTGTRRWRFAAGWHTRPRCPCAAVSSRCRTTRSG